MKPRLCHTTVKRHRTKNNNNEICIYIYVLYQREIKCIHVDKMMCLSTGIQNLTPSKRQKIEGVKDKMRDRDVWGKANEWKHVKRFVFGNCLCLKMMSLAQISYPVMVSNEKPIHRHLFLYFIYFSNVLLSMRFSVRGIYNDANFAQNAIEWRMHDQKTPFAVRNMMMV